MTYDGWNLIAEVDGTSNSLLKSYVWGEDLSGSLQGAGGVGGLLAVKEASGTYSPCYDGNGNVLAYVDSTGAKVAEYDFDPFGRMISKSGLDTFNFLFSSKYYEKETGLYYYGYRFYNAEVKRWINRDPMAEDAFVTVAMNSVSKNTQRRMKMQAQASPYTFVSNAPTVSWDYMGLVKYDLIVALIDEVTDVAIFIPMGNRYKTGVKPWSFGAAKAASFPLKDKAATADKEGGIWYDPDMLLVALTVTPEDEKEESCIKPFVYSIENMAGTRTGNYNNRAYPSGTNTRGISGSFVWDIKRQSALDVWDVFTFAGFNLNFPK